MSTAIGVVGLGAMGRPVVEHLLAAGYDVAVTDVREEPIAALTEEGATPAESPREMGAACEIIVVLVEDEKQTEAVVCGEDGLAAGEAEDLVVVISSTVSPELCRDLAERTPDGVRIADAPVCGADDGARRGELIVFVGADADVYKRIEPVLEHLARQGDIHHMGGLGLGQVAKSANNALLWTALVANAEMFALCEEYGIDVGELTDALSKTSGSNWGVDTWTERYPREIPWAHKDMRLTIDMAERQGQTMPLAGLVRELVRDLQAEWNDASQE
jgi:3-hydroxyisobutyrate dehydrogenase-like beta-hydroxyacid dehydrogenase